jgi:glutaredoxin-like protein
MALFNEETKKQLKDILVGLDKTANILLFTEKETCDSCSDTVTFMEEIQSLSDKITLKTYDLNDQEAKDYKVDKAPAIVLLDEAKNDFGIKFYGIPAGHEINSFLSGLMEVSGAGEKLPEEMAVALEEVSKPVNIKVFVTLACPHCSGAVSKAHKLAFENQNIQAEMIECGTFPELANEYNVSGVPKIVFDNGEELVGNQPFDQFIAAVSK